MSIIVPAHNAANDIAACLSAIRASTIPASYQLIVVDDASTDETASLAATYADRVIRCEAPARGPAFVRNKGVASSRGTIVLFVDADVVVRDDAIGRVIHAFAATDADAVFGSYDDRPAAGGVVSQYRNLLHHFVHQKSPGAVQSFWAGCGAVKRSAFDAVGRFDADRFHHAEMEDVDLGYRLVDAGYSIVLDPSIQGTHRKKFTLAGMIKADFVRRGVPWATVLLDRGEFLAPRGLSLGISERVSALASTLFALALIAAVILKSELFAIATLAVLGAFIVANASFFKRLIQLRGAAFALAAIPLHLLYSVTAVTALVWALVSYPVTRIARARYTRRR